MIKLHLPYPPSLNHYYRHVGPRTLISREGREFRRKVCSILAASGARPFAGPIHVAVDLYPPDRRRRDVDNAMKSLLDALEKAEAYQDDGQIKDLEIHMREPVEGGKAIVRIESVCTPHADRKVGP